MSGACTFDERIDLHVRGRISEEDARRQTVTARAILERLERQPGLILADEVGMGKTFVALAVATSVALARREPVVVMVPPSLREKWPADFKLFCEKCLPPDLAGSVTFGHAERAVQFLKLLDDPPSRRKSIIFVTHGALSRGLQDKWVMLAIIAQAIKGKWGVHRLRGSLSRCLGELLHMPWIDRGGEDVWIELLRAHPSDWLGILESWDLHPDRADTEETIDDPVPEAVWKALPDVDTRSVFESLDKIPRYVSKNYASRVKEARRAIKQEIRAVWKECVSRLHMRLPLLVLDEAHHLKNAKTKLASLFHAEEAKDDADEITRGPLEGVFERMLFLTATPFQLGHGELCSVLDRFDGIAWRSRSAPPLERNDYREAMKALRDALDAAQEAAIRLDSMWGRLTPDDLEADGGDPRDVESWWRSLPGETKSPQVAAVREAYDGARERLRRAEEILRPWVIRHLKPRTLPHPHDPEPRRRRLPGGRGPAGEPIEAGIEVSGRALLPFLLAARATALTPESRPVFAEGLASSYEAFLHTRRLRVLAKKPGSEVALTDTDDDPDAEPSGDAGDTRRIGDSARWYLDRLADVIPTGDARASLSHPKLALTVEQVRRLWLAGEKVVVFCHYVVTGRTLRNRISEALDAEIVRLGAEKLGVPEGGVHEELERLGKRFFDEDSPVRRACDEEARRIVADFALPDEYRDPG